MRLVEGSNSDSKWESFNCQNVWFLVTCLKKIFICTVNPVNCLHQQTQLISQGLCGIAPPTQRWAADKGGEGSCWSTAWHMLIKETKPSLLITKTMKEAFCLANHQYSLYKEIKLEEFGVSLFSSTLNKYSAFLRTRH